MEIKPNQKPIIAKRDKACYKILRPINPDSTLLKCREDEYTYQVNTMMPHIELKSVREKYPKGFKWFVDKGYHSRTQLNSEERVLRMEVMYCWYKCIIPKGSLYYEGRDDDDRKCYLSDNIMVVERKVTESFWEEVNMRKEHLRRKEEDRKTGRQFPLY